MNRRCNKFSRRSRSGATLIEVLAGLVVLGTVLSSVLIARGRFLRQWGDAQQKINAAHAADALLEKWMSGPAEMIPLGEERLNADLRWRTQRVANTEAAKLEANVVRLEILRQRDAKPLVSVEFLVHRSATTRRSR